MHPYSDGLWGYVLFYFISSPSRNICLYHLSRYVLSGHVATAHSPISLAFTESSHTECHSSDNGHVDSIRMLLYHENFAKPYSEEHVTGTFLKLTNVI